MVSRKNPLVSTSSLDATQADVSHSIPPYPTTPTKEGANVSNNAQPTFSPQVHESPGFDLIDLKDGQTRSRSNSETSHGTWDTDSEEEDGNMPRLNKFNEADVPKPLRISPSKQNIKQTEAKTTSPSDSLPSILRPGPTGSAPAIKPGKASLSDSQVTEDAQANPWATSGISTPNRVPVNAPLESNNPYRQQNTYESQNSQAIWREPNPAVPLAAPPPPPPPVEMPTIHTPANELQSIPWEIDRPLTTASYDTVEVLPVPQQGRPPLAPIAAKEPQIYPSTNPWKQDGEAASQPKPISETSSVPLSTQNVTQPSNSDVLLDLSPSVQQHDLTQSRAQISTPSTSAQTSTTFTRPGAEQRAEHYSIKCVNWYDVRKPGLRRSPILTQMANGPCPLLALVNALSLSTPHDANTALVEALQTRETISLGLLLDAVFDELMSGRREPGPFGLPDVDELYAFLLALHTGMNVNPRFITAAVTPRGSFDGHPAAVAHVHPSDRAQTKPGCFEETREMRLYSTFQIPLIHGWVPVRGSLEYEAFDRTAQTFEDAQNIQFAESELEDKRQHEGLGFQEEQILTDIRSIKAFFQNWPTQLTDYGLETMSQSLNAGQIAILFRNDHFSTIYKEPKHGALMTLITDAGYSSHEEIVWESLVDVNGAASEMFSGDFRVVSHHNSHNLNQNSSAGGDEGWQTVTGRTGQRPPLNDFDNVIPPPLPGPRPNILGTSHDLDGDAALSNMSAREQEDHDLALALQLQEEEEDRERQAQERRLQEQRLSEQMLSNEAEGVRPQIPPRRNTNMVPNNSRRDSRVAAVRPPSGRPAVSRPSDNPSDPEAPPTYEQAASDRPYRPDGTTPAGAQGSPLNAYDALMAQQTVGQSQPSLTNSGFQGGRRRGDNRPGRPASGYAPSSAQPARYSQAAGVRDAEERCTVM